MRQFKIRKSFTNRSEESLDKYLLEISRVPMITTEEEVVLAQAIHAGGKKGEEAKEKLVTANLRFVVSVAKHPEYNGALIYTDGYAPKPRILDARIRPRLLH